MLNYGGVGELYSIGILIDMHEAALAVEAKQLATTDDAVGGAGEPKYRQVGANAWVAGNTILPRQR